MLLRHVYMGWKFQRTLKLGICFSLEHFFIAVAISTQVASASLATSVFQKGTKMLLGRSFFHQVLLAKICLLHQTPKVPAFDYCGRISSIVGCGLQDLWRAWLRLCGLVQIQSLLLCGFLMTTMLFIQLVGSFTFATIFCSINMSIFSLFPPSL